MKSLCIQHFSFKEQLKFRAHELSMKKCLDLDLCLIDSLRPIKDLSVKQGRSGSTLFLKQILQSSTG